MAGHEADIAAERSILIVDDAPENLHMLVRILTAQGYKPRAVRSGKLALTAAANDPPDLILLDITMPGMDGYEVCRRLKENDRLKDIPVIFLSALDETEDKVRAFAAGCVDYVTKPFQVEEIRARVDVRRQPERGRSPARHQTQGAIAAAGQWAVGETWVSGAPRASPSGRPLAR